MTQIPNGTAITPSTDGTFTFPAGITFISFSGRSADGSNGSGVNGGGAATFSGVIDTGAGIIGGATGIAIVIPPAGSEADLTIQLADGINNGAGINITSGDNGVNGGAGAISSQDDGSWLTSFSSGASNSISGAGSDGSVTFTWGGPVAANLSMMCNQ